MSHTRPTRIPPLGLGTNDPIHRMYTRAAHTPTRPHAVSLPPLAPSPSAGELRVRGLPERQRGCAGAVRVRRRRTGVWGVANTSPIETKINENGGVSPRTATAPQPHCCPRPLLAHQDVGSSVFCTNRLHPWLPPIAPSPPPHLPLTCCLPPSSPPPLLLLPSPPLLPFSVPILATPPPPLLPSFPLPQSLGAGALLVNPWNISDMATAIYDALSMSEDERRERHRQNYMHVQVGGKGGGAWTLNQCRKETATLQGEAAAAHASYCGGRGGREGASERGSERGQQLAALCCNTRRTPLLLHCAPYIHAPPHTPSPRLPTAYHLFSSSFL